MTRIQVRRMILRVETSAWRFVSASRTPRFCYHDRKLRYSKLLDHHRLAVALFIWHFNFARKHGAYGVTPAYAAGIAGKEPMKIEDLLKWKNTELSAN